MSEASFPPLLANLLDRLEGQETLEVEFKAARGSLPNSVWETVSAFANTNGGWIILGVSEDENGAPEVIGVSDASSQLKVFCDNLRNPQRISYPPCGATDTSVEIVDDKELIIIRVRAAPLRDRPVYVKGNPYAGTYVRRHSGDYLCNKQEVDRMMREASTVAADSAVLPKFGWQDLDVEAFARYRRLFRSNTPTHPANAYDDQRFLEVIGGFRRDRETSVEGLTVAGLLMFGTPEAIREWRTRHLIDYRLLPGDSDLESRWEDRVTWEGNLLAAFETIYPRLIDGLPRPFRLEDGRRIDDSPVHVALREALVNLLVHADYAETQVSLVTRSPRGYLFRNPGSSRVSEIDLLTGDRSDPRNPSLVRMFRFIGFAEEAGTGIPKIRQAWRELGYRMPGINVDTERYEFVLSLHHVHLLSEDDVSWLISFGIDWTEAERLALVLARHDEEVDNLKLRSLTGQHAADVTKVLGGLRDRGFLQMIGGGRGARYELGPSAVTVAEAVPASITEGVAVAFPPGEFAQEGPRSEEGGQSSEDSGSNSDDLTVSTEDLARDLEDLTRSTEDSWKDLREISRLAREHPYLDAATRDDLLVRVCSIKPLTLRELAELLNRSEAHLRETLRHLIETGRLAYLYPNQPRHPRQKYVGFVDRAAHDQDP